MRKVCSGVAFCDSIAIIKRIKTLYLRNVPDDVATRLKILADRAGMSVSAFAVRELSMASRRADNEAILAGPPDLDISSRDILAALKEGRAGR